MPREAAYTIETFSRRTLLGRRHFFRIRATNGQVVAQSEGYANKIDRDMVAGHLRGGLIEAEIVDA